MSSVKSPVSNLQYLLAALLLASILVACSSPIAGRTLEDQIREYLYEYQPTTGQQFVEWANENLADYSSLEVYEALHKEGELQAKLGHPNAVGVLSFVAQAWAAENGLRYDPNKWLVLYEEGMKNLRDNPGELQLWPE